MFRDKRQAVSDFDYFPYTLYKPRLKVGFSIIKIKTGLWGELIDYSCARCSPVERGCPVGLRIIRIEIIMDSETIKIVSNASGKNYGSGNFKRILSKQGVRIFINRLSIEK